MRFSHLIETEHEEFIEIISNDLLLEFDSLKFSLSVFDS